MYPPTLQVPVHKGPIELQDKNKAYDTLVRFRCRLGWLGGGGWGVTGWAGFVSNKLIVFVLTNFDLNTLFAQDF